MRRWPEIEERKELFEAVNKFVRARHGWITSITGSVDVTLECLPASLLPDELRNLGYHVREIGAGQRIVPTAIAEQFVIGADGELSPHTEASTRLITTTVHHAGIIEVKRYAFEMP